MHPFVLGLILAMGLRPISGCPHSPHSPHSHHGEQQHLEQFRSKVLHKMRMAEEQMEDVPLETVVEARKMLPMMEDHSKKELDHVYVVEQKTALLARGDHLFVLPSSVPPLIDASLTLHLTPSAASSLMTVFVQARELGSEEVYSFATHEFLTSHHPKQLNIKVDKQLVERWLESPTPSIVLSLVFRDVETDVILYTDEVVAKSIVLQLDVATPPTRKRRSTVNKCKEDEPNQECCIRERSVTFKELGINNVISPSNTVVSWCEGACLKESSFQNLFAGYTTKVLDGGKPVERCCHAIETEYVDVMFLNGKQGITNERIYDVKAVKCACA